MSDITISYKGSNIATMDATGTKTLLTEGKYCEDDISIAYVKPSGGGGIPKANFIDFMEGDSTTIDFSGITKLHIGALTGFVMASAYFPDVTTIVGYVARDAATPIFVFPALTSVVANSFRNAGSTLTTLDFGTSMTSIGQTSLYACSGLTTIILRSSSLVSLGGTNAFTNTKFASGGSGGTIYIPKSLYDHLGDNTSSDYKAATNWSTINGYGTITWAKIEGSIYENAYADGTPIPTT